MIILFGNRIFCGKPKILLCIKSIRKTASCKTFDRTVDIMHSLHNTRSVKIMYKLFRLASVLCCIYKFNFAGSRNFHLRTFVYITICMSCNRNRFLPILHTRLDSFHHDRSTKYRSVKNRTNRTVWTFPHLFQIILIHARCIWSNCSTFYRNLIFLGRHCRINRDLIVCLVSML